MQPTTTAVVPLPPPTLPSRTRTVAGGDVFDSPPNDENLPVHSPRSTLFLSFSLSPSLPPSLSIFPCHPSLPKDNILSAPAISTQSISSALQYTGGWATTTKFPVIFYRWYTYNGFDHRKVVHHLASNRHKKQHPLSEFTFMDTLVLDLSTSGIVNSFLMLCIIPH